MKYKKHIASGALAISLLVGGSSVYAASPQDLGIKNTQPTYQRQTRGAKGAGHMKIKKHSVVGTLTALNTSGFTLEIKNLKSNTVSSLDVKTDSTTTYTKNGASATSADLAVGQKVIVFGTIDKTANTATAKKVRIVIK